MGIGARARCGGGGGPVDGRAAVEARRAGPSVPKLARCDRRFRNCLGQLRDAIGRQPLCPARAPNERPAAQGAAAERCAQLSPAARQSRAVGREPVVLYVLRGIDQAGLQGPESLIMPAFAKPTVRKSQSAEVAVAATATQPTTSSPAARSASMQAKKVAPVVTTSSTSTIRRRAVAASRTRNACETFCRRAARSRLACCSVCRSRHSRRASTRAR